jgi:hypothetical protein
LAHVTNDYVVQEDSTIAINVKGLDSETIYHYRIVAANSVGTSYGRTVSFHNTFSEPVMPQTPSGGSSGGGCYISAIMGCRAANYGSCHLITLFAVPFSILFGRFLWNYIKPTSNDHRCEPCLSNTESPCIVAAQINPAEGKSAAGDLEFD